MSKEFHFTITDVARLLGKSPVTLRGWEHKGLIKFPRLGTDRQFTCNEVIKAAEDAHKLKRITRNRLNLVKGAMAMLLFVEELNGRRT
jgi:DNA-binding transcriptional MerR regulator